jgi:hypothetical protein
MSPLRGLADSVNGDATKISPLTGLQTGPSHFCLYLASARRFDGHSRVSRAGSLNLDLGYLSTTLAARTRLVGL